MICPACQTTCPDTARYCPTCGLRLTDAPAPISAAPTTSLDGFASPPAYASQPGSGAPANALSPGALLQGRYRIVSVLGNGAFGRVYLADDTQDPATGQVAIKELLDMPFGSPDEKREAVGWFKREVGTLLSLDHPGIPAIHAYWTARAAAGPFYLAMDYVPGKTLEQTLVDAGGRVPWRTVAAWGLALCDVLAYLHAQAPPFVFRDLKLPNVLVDVRAGAPGVPVLIDFGIARRLAGPGGTAIGTWGYVPLEQVLGRAEPRSDLYALGATLHALLTGRRPDAVYAQLQRDGRDVEGAMRALFPPADTLVPEIPASLSAVVARATAFAVADRFPDAAAMRDALHAVIGPPWLPSRRSSQPIASPAPIVPAPAPIVPALPTPAAHAQATPAPVQPAQPPTEVLQVAQGGQRHGFYTRIGDALRQARSHARIEVGPGTYDESLAIDHPVEIVPAARAGAGSVSVVSNGAPCLIVQTSEATVRGLSLRTVETNGVPEGAATVHVVRGRLTLEQCQLTLTGTSPCVLVDGPAAESLLRRCTIRDAGGPGVLFDGTHGTLEDCDITGSAGAAVVLMNGAAGMLRRCAIRDGRDSALAVLRHSRVTVEGCPIEANDGTGIYADGESSVVASRCDIRRSGESGLYLNRDSQATIEDCTIVGSLFDGIIVANYAQVMARKSHIRGSHGAGVFLDINGRGALDDCTIADNGHSGVEVHEGASVRIRGGAIGNNGEWAIRLYHRAEDDVLDCDLRGNANGPWKTPWFGGGRHP